MYQKLAIAILTLIFTAALPTPSWAETVIEKVARTGVLTAGTRVDIVPLAYVDDKGEWTGYSVEILRLIQEQLQKRLDKKVDLQLVEIGVRDRIPKLLSREVDIICEAVSYTWERDKFIDFSISYGVMGTQLLTKKGSNLDSEESLIGKRIGVIPKTTSEQVIKLVQPRVTLIPLKDNLKEAFAALERGKIDALVGDGLILQGFMQTTSNPDKFEVVPKKPYIRQGLACMIPENNSSLRQLVDYTIVQFFQAVVTGEPKANAMLNTWFGSEGITPIDRNLIIDFFNYVIDSREQIRQ
ncbi:MAG: extracellular substrate binding-like orphan protein GrrP [Prochloraceae cyanobacterium]